MALNAVEQRKLSKYLEHVGRMTSDEALQLALEAEQIAKDVGPTDYAFAKFKNDEIHFFEYAELLEKEAA